MHLRAEAEGGSVVRLRRCERGASCASPATAPRVRPNRSSALPAGTPCSRRNLSSTLSNCASTWAKTWVHKGL